ncbi:hypothetical protein C8F04DRAFT_1239626 [Mycena alexandri]|uniref:Uncharacterized protein n=1 Tax=Mycena alexandri TaxID=1745969 RepID=A0AAD6SFD4_9AGAR|nr:hypothetical protein C8F04DRAFT_1239626 [Mycena alexandri]
MFRGGSISSKAHSFARVKVGLFCLPDLTNQTIGHIKIEDFLFPPPLLPFERVSRHMRVTIHTEIEPPGIVESQCRQLILTSLESRPCPPLPIDGPILLRALSSAASSHSTAVSGAPACLAFPASTLKKSSGDDVSTQDTSGAPTVPTPTVHVKFMLWDASSWLAVVLGMILILIILMIVPLPFSCRNLSPPFSHHGCSEKDLLLIYLMSGAIQMREHLDFARHGGTRALCCLSPVHDWIWVILLPDPVRIRARRLPDGAMSILWRGGCRGPPQHMMRTAA